MPKTSKSKAAVGRHDPLANQILADTTLPVRALKEKAKVKAKAAKEGVEEIVLPANLSQKVLKQAREQQEEIAREMGGGRRGGRGVMESKHMEIDSDEDDSELSDDENADEEWVRVGEDGFVDVAGEADADDEALLARFMNPDAGARRTLGEIIAEKIRAQEEAAVADGILDPKKAVDPKVAQVYTEVGVFLKTYRAGKLPKVFKILPGLSNWEQVLYLTNPDQWSAHAMYAATRVFASNLNAHMAQRFYNTILLGAVRDDIAEHKRLNYHLYQALLKALYKPAAFFKGILLPLAESKCTLKEAVIVGSVIAKKSVPYAHSAACLIKLAAMPFSPATSVFVKILINKKYALSYSVIDRLVAFFSHMGTVQGPLPVLWHQSLLLFVQRYKADINTPGRELLRALMKAHTHPQITPEIRRELFSVPARDASEPGPHHDDPVDEDEEDEDEDM